jgi:UDP-N-acetylglucosamine transferase subunit ALG13
VIFITVSTGHFDPLVAACDDIADRFSFEAQIGSGTYVPSFPHFRTAPPAELEERMRAAELVIAHAGTGTLTTLYRLRKRAIVVPKQPRYGEANASQVELAVKWGELGIATVLYDVGKMEGTLGVSAVIDG